MFPDQNSQSITSNLQRQKIKSMKPYMFTNQTIQSIIICQYMSTNNTIQLAPIIELKHRQYHAPPASWSLWIFPTPQKDQVRTNPSIMEHLCTNTVLVFLGFSKLGQKYTLILRHRKWSEKLCINYASPMISLSTCQQCI